MERALLAICLTIAFTSPYVNAIALGEAPAQTVQSLMAEARDAQSRGDFSKAAEAYQKVVKLEPSIPELWANLGLMNHESGKHAEAIRSFQQAIRMKPSLFVPQLFLGIEYVESKNPKEAIPFLKNAVLLNPKDLQTSLYLGKAYAMLDQGDEAANYYSNAIQIAPNNGEAWLALGTSYLKQVESDARLMTSRYGNSSYGNLRAGEVLAEEGKLVQAEESYKLALASSSPAPCAHAELGISLLRDQKIPEAREQFALEVDAASHCGLAPLGAVVADLVDGHLDLALQGLNTITTADAGFVRSSLPLFRGAVSSERAKSLIDLAHARQVNGAPSINISSLVESTLLSEGAPVAMAPAEVSQAAGVALVDSENAEKFNAAGQFSKCSEALKQPINSIGATRLQILASCSFYTGEFQATSMAAQRLKADPATRVQGLYWESKADEKLAIAALIRAGEIDANSPRMHVLLGDAFRQERRWDDSETEYRKAVALDSKSHSARISLAIVLFTELKTEEAFDIDRSLLGEDPIDPEANLLAGEILVQRNLFREAEPYLMKHTNLSPELIPRMHVLRGQMYAETNRIVAAISEYKLCLSTDEDGSIHYRLGRLYMKTGQKATAEEAFRESKRIQGQRDERARIGREVSPGELSRE
jgi:tetratricopeptide (TPR) repeat protein